MLAYGHASLRTAASMGNIVPACYVIQSNIMLHASVMYPILLDSFLATQKWILK